jgi:hypothetical protein
MTETEEEIVRIGLQTTTDGWLVCPTCIRKGKATDPCIYVHPLEVRIATGYKTIKINGNGVFTSNEPTEDSKEAIGNRGVRITIVYNCEDGHLGDLIFQFSKGNTRILHKFLEEIDCEDERYCNVIWRD